MEYLFLGRIAAVLQGYPDTTQDADLFVAKTPGNGGRLTAALRELGFRLSADDEREIVAAKAIIPLRKRTVRRGRRPRPGQHRR